MSREASNDAFNALMGEVGLRLDEIKRSLPSDCQVSLVIKVPAVAGGILLSEMPRSEVIDTLLEMGRTKNSTGMIHDGKLHERN